MVDRSRNDKLSGKVVYSSRFIPAEWIAAHGLVPSRMAFVNNGLNTPVSVEAGVCPFMRAFINNASEDPGTLAIVLVTTCDQMRRGADFVNLFTKKSCFLMHIPSTSGISGAGKLYMSELERLGRFLVSLGGIKPSPEELVSVMEEYNTKRKRLLSCQGVVTGRKFAEETESFWETGETSGCRHAGRPDAGSISIGFIGGPIGGRDLELFDILLKHGASVVMNATETGERSFPEPFDLRRLSGDAMQVLAEAYLGSAPDVFQRPNDRIFAWVKKAVADRGIRGLVLIRYVWCDKWRGEVYRFRESSSVPLLDIELDGERIGESTKNRVQAFMEALR